MLRVFDISTLPFCIRLLYFVTLSPTDNVVRMAIFVLDSNKATNDSKKSEGKTDVSTPEPSKSISSDAALAMVKGDPVRGKCIEMLETSLVGDGGTLVYYLTSHTRIDKLYSCKHLSVAINNC